MKKTCFPVLAALFIFGCASSDRAFRMSGGVLDTYSAPKEYRLRSEKFRKMEQMSIPHSANKPAVGDLNDTLVNIWPFYFRNKNYFSVLWPMIDWDPYGMAIRPFYNQEGDDYSIMFPLSAWNTANKSGWVANFGWTANGFGFIPLSWQNRTKNEFWCYYTPFFIATRDYRKPGFDYKTDRMYYSSENFTELLLGYYGEEHQVDLKGWDCLFSYRPLADTELEYKLWKSGIPQPKNTKELNALRKAKEKELSLYKSVYGGFFPLFHLKRTPYNNSYTWNIAGLLADVECSDKQIDVSILAKFLFSYKNEEFNQYQAVRYWSNFDKSFFILPLLSGRDESRRIKETDTVTQLRDLASLVHSGNFAEQLPKVNEQLEKLVPGTKVPEFINSKGLLDLYIADFIKDYCAKHKFEYYTTGKAGCVPLFMYTWQEHKKSWFSLPLLSGGETEKNGDWMWLSIPLLSGASHTAHKDTLCIAPPLVYSSTTQRFEKYKFVQPSNAKWSRDKYDNIESTDIYACCGLFYRGQVKFLVAKPEYSHKDINKLCSLCHQLQRTKRDLDEREKNYQHDLKLANEIKHRNKIEYYEKMIVLENLKIRRAEIDKEWKSFNKNIAKAQKLAEKLKIKLAVTDWADDSQIAAAVKNLYDTTTAVREKADIGNGLFFRKEIFYNGDWKWHLFLNIAGGEKDGTKESTHILHFLYRNRVDGDRQEKLVFPFISLQKDGKNSRTSFLGRIFQKSVIDGKVSGYIFFIPFGN